MMTQFYRPGTITHENPVRHISSCEETDEVQAAIYRKMISRTNHQIVHVQTQSDTQRLTKDNNLLGQPSAISKSVATADVSRSDITYELVPVSGRDGYAEPILIGQGRFAKVYKACQRGADNVVRSVAIKILHEHVDRRAEQLFVQEIRLLKQLASPAGGNVKNILDILHLGPMIMCGNCGQIYHPRCPQCGQYLLKRCDPPKQAHAALRCQQYPSCNYMLSGAQVQGGAAIGLPHSSLHCFSKQHRDGLPRGKFINFVDRAAVVLELIEDTHSISRGPRPQTYLHFFPQAGRLQPPEHVSLDPNSGNNNQSLPRPPLRASLDMELEQRALLMAKIVRMVQFAEAVRWLHGSQQTNHRDIKLENILLAAPSAPPESVALSRSLPRLSPREMLTGRAPYEFFKVIDLELLAQEWLSRSRGEEPASNISQHLPTEPLPSHRSWLEIARKIASTLVALHSGEIVHETLSPTNVQILCEPSAAERPIRVRVLDFGIARMHSTEGPTHTIAGAGSLASAASDLWGDCEYESLCEAMSLRNRSDQFALACLVMELLSRETLAPPTRLRDEVHFERLISETAPWNHFPYVLGRVLTQLLSQLTRRNFCMCSARRELEMVLDQLREHSPLPGDPPIREGVTLRSARAGNAIEKESSLELFLPAEDPARFIEETSAPEPPVGSCAQMEEFISRSIDEDLTLAEEEQLRAHLQTCRACSKNAEQMTAAVRRLRMIGEAVRPPSPLYSQVMDRLERPNLLAEKRPGAVSNSRQRPRRPRPH